MKQINWRNCSEEEMWEYVGLHLAKHGLDAVLVGGSVVSIYTDGAYRSGDLDFVIQNLVKDQLPEAMKEMGFEKRGRHYIHPECSHLFVEFPPGPLGIGEDKSIKPAKREVSGSEIKILTPTDCVKDRLASYLYFRSQEGLDQALLVAEKQSVNLEAIKKWCEGEGAPEVFEEFENALKS